MSQKKNIIKRKPLKKTGRNSSKKKNIQKPIEQISLTKPLPKIIFALVLFAISLTTYIAYYPSLENDFTNWDDNSYVEKNPVIHELSKETIHEMFNSEDDATFYHMGNYHPLSMLSLSIDHALETKYPDTFKKKGMRMRNETGKIYSDFDPYIYHLHNLILHILNSLLVFLFIYLLFNQFDYQKKFLFAAFTSILFAVSTIHVESVTWISERKDVLYTFYFLISIILYLKFLERRKIIWLLVSLAAFLLSLLSKGQAVSLAVTLVAIDLLRERKDIRNIIIEKIPFFLLALVFGLIAIQAQSHGEAIHDISDYPFYHRILFAAYGLTMYFAKLLYPFSLSAVYPYPYGEVPSYFWAFLIPLSTFIVAFFYFFKKNKIIAFGLAFFIINVFLVLQLLPVGSAIMADRYAYIPSIGFSLILAYVLVQLSQKNKNMQFVSIAIVVLYSLFLSNKTHTQTKIWKNSLTLWEHSLSISPKAVVAWNNWGSAIDKVASEQENPNEKIRLKEQAIQKFTRAVELKVDYAHAFYNRGTSRKDIGMISLDPAIFKSSIKDFDKAIQLDNEFAEAYQNRAISRENIANFDGAIADFNKAIQYKPEEADLYSGRGVVKGKQGKFDEAITDFNKSIEVNPNHNEGYSNRGYAYYLSGNIKQAIADYNRSLQIEPDNADALFNRGVAYAFQKQYNLALTDYNIVQQKKPQMQMLYINRGLVFMSTNRQKEACTDFQTALNLGSPYAQRYLEAYCK